MNKDIKEYTDFLKSLGNIAQLLQHKLLIQSELDLSDILRQHLLEPDNKTIQDTLLKAYFRPFDTGTEEVKSHILAENGAEQIMIMRAWEKSGLEFPYRKEVLEELKQGNSIEDLNKHLEDGKVLIRVINDRVQELTKNPVQ